LSFPESDWRVLRSIRDQALERYCARVLDECAAVLRSAEPAHDRYLRLWRLLKERDDGLAAAFDHPRRSAALQQLAAMATLGVLTDAELSRFGGATREMLQAVTDVRRGARRGRRSAQ
jgi:hypothetical protein